MIKRQKKKRLEVQPHDMNSSRNDEWQGKCFQGWKPTLSHSSKMSVVQNSLNCVCRK